MRSVERVTQLVANISDASRQQSYGTSQVDTAVVQLDTMTQQNAALVEQAAAASSSLNDDAQRLDAIVGRFKLAD